MMNNALAAETRGGIEGGYFNRSRSGREFEGCKIHNVYATFDAGSSLKKSSCYEPLGESCPTEYEIYSCRGGFSNSNIVVKEWCTGKGYASILTVDGRLFFIGDNAYGFCGLDGIQLSNPVNELTEVSVALKGNFVRRFNHVGNGMYFMVALTADFKLISVGSNECGQRGVGQGGLGSFMECVFNKSLIYLKDKILRGIIKIACGYQHCIALVKDGTMIGTGCSYQRQLGTVENDISYEFTQLSSPKATAPIVDIQCGFFCSLCVDANGMVYVLGLADYTRLTEGQEWTKLQTFVNDPVQYVLMSCSNSFFRTASGAVHHNWGIEETSVTKHENMVELGTPNVKHVFGKEHFFVVTEKNEIYLSGVGSAHGISHSPSTTPWFEHTGFKNVISAKTHFFIVDAMSFCLYITASPNDGNLQRNLGNLLKQAQDSTSDKNYFFDIFVK